jgi:hypothetical protein
MLMFETSESTAKLDAALSKAQGEFSAATKDAENPAFKANGKTSKYADLSSVWSAIRPALSKHGIAVTQWPIHSDDNKLHMVTRLGHEGEWIRAEFSIPVTKHDAHGYGSATTYAKRFSLAAAVGVIVDDDDDGNAASKQANGNGRHPDMTHIQGNPDAKHYTSNGTTAKAIEARKNNEFWLKCQEECRAQTTPEALKSWLKVRHPEMEKRMTEEDLDLFASDIYEPHKDSLLARMPA